MSESNFFGYNYFYPGLYTPDEANGIRLGMNRDLWPLVMDVCSKAGEGNLYISTKANNDIVLLVNKHGYPTLALRCTGGDSPAYVVENWHHYLKQRGKSRYKLVSANRSYIVKQLIPHVEPLLRQINSRMHTQLVTAAQYFGKFLNRETDDANEIARVLLQPEELYAALRTLFESGFTQIQIDHAMLKTLRTHHDDLAKKFAKKKSYAERMSDMFDHPKFVFAVVPQLNETYLMSGIVKFTNTHMNGYGGNFGLEFIRPLRLYRNLAHVYAEHPEDEGAMKTALMFCKVHREKEPTTKTYDAEGFLPCVKEASYEEIGGISYCDTVTAQLVNPQWLLLSK